MAMTATPETLAILGQPALVLSGRANELAQQIEQAALQPVSSSDKLELVDHLTDYVSDALQQGSLADDELQYLFQLTSQLGDQEKHVSGPPGCNLAPASQTKCNAAGMSLSMTVDELNAIKQSRPTADLLSWADDIANVSGSLQGIAKNELGHVHLHPPKQQMTSREAAAKALVKAARHVRSSTRFSSDTPSRYMDSSIGRLVLPLHQSASGNLEAEAAGAIEQACSRHATPAYLLGLQNSVTSSIPAHIRLYQLSDTWRRHKEQLRVEQEQKDSRAASPSPPARLSSHVRQRAAERLYAHAKQRQNRQQAAMAQQESQPPATPSSFVRNAPDFHQRQQSLLARRHHLAQQRRPRDEESLQHCTSRPAISASAHSLRRSTADLLAWHRRKEERLQQLRREQALQEDEQLTLTPRINPASRHMALHLARRVADQDPRLLTVIQSQPQGWVLGARPPTPRRSTPASGATSTVGSQQALNPPWVQGSNRTTLMRLVQKAAERHLPAPHHHPKQQRVCKDGGDHQGHSGYEAAPWMAPGGVRHMDPDHMGACAKGHAAEQERGARCMQGMQSPMRAALSHIQQRTAAPCAVDPVEAPAPAWNLDAAAHQEAPSSLPPPAYSAPRHMAVPNLAGDGIADLGVPARNFKLQTSLSVEAEAARFTKAAEAGRIASMPPFAPMAPNAAPSLKYAEAAVGSPEEETAGAASHGVAAHAGTVTAGSFRLDAHAQTSVVSAAAADNRHAYCRAALPEASKQSSQPESNAAFSGFDVPKADVALPTEPHIQPGNIAAFSGFDVPEHDLPEDIDALPTAQNSSVADVSLLGPSRTDEKSHASSENPDMPDRSNANASTQVGPVKSNRRTSGTQVTPFKVERRMSGSPVAPTRTNRSSSGVFSRGSAGIGSGRAALAGASKAAGAGLSNKEGQLAQGKFTLAAAPTSAVSGKTLRALALKAAAKARVAACVPPLPARVSHSAASQSSVLVNTDEQHQAVQQAGNFEVVSMHSIVMQSPATLPSKKQLSGLNARAVEAAIKHVLAARGSELESQKFTRQASGRRISAERKAA